MAYCYAALTSPRESTVPCLLGVLGTTRLNCLISIMSNVRRIDMNFAQITVSGNIGADPEVRDVNGTKVANFSVAVNENYTNLSLIHISEPTRHA